MFTFFLISLSTVSVSSLLLGHFTLLKSEKNKTALYWGLTCFSVFFWAVGLLLTVLSNHETTGLFWLKIHYIGAFFIPSFFLIFILSYINTLKKPIFITLISLNFFISTCFCFLNMGHLISSGISRHFFDHYYTQPGPLFLVFLTWYFTTAALTHLYAFFKINTLPLNQKKPLQFILIGSSLGFLGGGTTIFPVLNIAIFPFGVPLVMLYTLTVTYSIMKHNLMNITAIINRIASHCIVYGGLFLILTLSFTYLRSYIALFTMCIVGIISCKYGDVLRQKLQTTADKKWVKEWYSTEDALHALSKNLRTALDKQRIFTVTTDSLSHALEIHTATYIYLHTSPLEQPKYSLVNDSNYTFEASHPLIDYFSKNTLPINLKKLPHELQDTIQMFFSTKQGILLPLYSPEQLEGIILFGERASEAPFKDKELDFFTLTQSTLNIYLERIRPYEKIKQQYENILKKDTVLTTIATLNQEVNAPLQAVFCSTFLLKKELIHSDNEAIRKSLSGIEEDLGKIRLIVKRLMGIIRAEKKPYPKNSYTFKSGKDPI